MGKQVVPFTGIRNPGGEVGLGDEGRKEFTVSHNEYETCRISILFWCKSYNLLWHLFQRLSMATRIKKKSQRDLQDSEKSGP